MEYGSSAASSRETRLIEDMASVEEFPFVVIFDSDYSMPGPMEAFGKVLPYSVSLAFIGLVESLMTQQLLNEMTGKKGDPSRECLGQGIANLASGMLGGMGGCAMIGQSMINVKSGGLSRVSCISAAFFLLVVIMFASPIINIIPVAGLVGVMFMVVIHTFEWFSIKLIFTSLLPKRTRDCSASRPSRSAALTAWSSSSSPSLPSSRTSRWPFSRASSSPRSSSPGTG